VLLLATLAAVGILGVAQEAAAQWARPRGVNPTGDPICPSNYLYDRGWCKSIYGESRGGYYRERPYRGYQPRRYGGYDRDGVPPQWDSAGSAVCPDGYDYFIQYDKCLFR